MVFLLMLSNIYHLLDSLVDIFLTNADFHASQHFSKSVSQKPKERKYKEKEIFKERKDRKGRKRTKTVSIAHPPVCRSFLLYPQNNLPNLF